ncbi:MAG: TetR/AcrR family transcriptional regulator [Desulfobaccales bacterium]
MTTKSMDRTRITKKEVVTAFRTGEILAAAYRLMEHKGVDTLTMDDIAQAAGVAKGTLYLYFQSKDELIQALLSQVGEALAQEVEAILAQALPASEKLKLVVNLFLTHMEKERVLFPVYLRELVRSKSGRATTLTPKLRGLEERIMGLLTGLFTEGMAQGQFIQADPFLLAHLLKGLVRAVGYFQMSQADPGSVRESLPVVLQLLFSGVVLPSEFAKDVQSL